MTIISILIIISLVTSGVSGCRVTTNDSLSISCHLSRSSTALCDLSKDMSVHFQMFSSPLFCLPLRLPPASSVPCRIVLAKHMSIHFFFHFLHNTKNAVIKLNSNFSSSGHFVCDSVAVLDLITRASIRLWESAARAQDSQVYRKIEISVRLSLIFDFRMMFLSCQIHFSFINALHNCKYTHLIHVLLLFHLFPPFFFFTLLQDCCLPDV